MDRYALNLGAALVGVVALAALAVAPAEAATATTTPTITIALSPDTLDYGHQTVVVSGTVSAVPAGTAVTIGYENSSDAADQVVATTGASGGYQATIANPEAAAQTVTATVAATDSTDAASASAPLGFSKDDVTITAGFASPVVDAGLPDLMTGTVTYTSAGGQVPLAGMTLTLTTDAYFVPKSATVTTAADGSFSYLAPGTYGGSEDYTISSAATPFLNAAEQHASFDINLAAGITQFTGTLSAEHVLRFDACGGLAEPLADGPLFGPLYYQYATKASGPWRTLGVGRENENGPCFDAAYGANYPGKFRAPPTAGYYRAYTPRVKGQTPAVSNVIHLWRYQAKITGFALTPRKVARNGKITVSGRLWRRGTKWLADAKQKVTIEYRYHGKTYKLRQLTTTSSGRFSGTFRVPRTARWLAVYAGGRNQFSVATKPAEVTVR